MSLPLAHERSGDTNFTRVASWVQLVFLIIALSSTVAVAAVSLLDLQTATGHDDDIAALRSEGQAEREEIRVELRYTNQILQCILWDVPAERCEAVRR